MRLFLLIVLVVFGAASLDETLLCLKNYVESFRNRINPQLFRIFAESFSNTMATTVKHFDLTLGKESTYIITGDIQAMWLRDSTNQFLPYIRMNEQCPNVRSLAKGLINTQAEFIMTDPYTNAFKLFQTNVNARPFYLNDKTQTLILGIPVNLCNGKEFSTKIIWERKFQIDSLASFLRLAYEYTIRYDSIDFMNINFLKAVNRIMSLIDEQTNDQLYEQKRNKFFYTFSRIPTELRNGRIPKSMRTGMIKTGFRPSDDPTALPYNIPGNAMASTYLNLVAQNVLDRVGFASVFHSFSTILSLRMKSVSKQIHRAIYNYGIIKVNEQQILAYQIDGGGGFKTYDDANLPSLLSLPYFKFIEVTDPLYVSTRSYVLSLQNIYYFQSLNGKIKGIGSSHTSPGMIWPLALMTQILTSTLDSQIKMCLDSLRVSAVNNLLHEAFFVDGPQQFTRNWFAWANSFFGEMISTLAVSKPHLIL